MSRRDGEEQVRLLILQGSTEEPRKNLQKIPQEVQPRLSTFEYLKASNGQASKKTPLWMFDSFKKEEVISYRALFHCIRICFV